MSIARLHITHQCPPAGPGIMPCCGQTPFEVPRTNRITVDLDLVTCGIPIDMPVDKGDLITAVEFALTSEGELVLKRDGEIVAVVLRPDRWERLREMAG